MLSQKKEDRFFSLELVPQEQQIALNADQFVQIVRKTIKKEVKKQSQKSFWQNMVVGIILFLLGVIASLLIYIVSTLHK